MGVIRALALALAAAPALADAPGDLRYLRVGPEGAPLHAEPGGAVVDRAAPGALVEGAPGPAGWVRVFGGETNHWLRAADASAESPPTQAEGALPDPLLCVGVEPFWSLRIASDGLRFSQLGGAPVTVDRLSAEAPAPGFAIVRFTGAQAGQAAIQRRDCSDGMSDALYPWSVDLTLEIADAPPRLSGCCRFAP